MEIIDTKFRQHKVAYIVQCLLAALAITIILLLMDVVAHTALIAALGASACIAFAIPRANVSRTRFLVGGYVMGIAAGVAVSLLHGSAAVGALGLEAHHAAILCGGLAVGLAIFLMVVTNTEHPPAAGVALGLVLNQWDYRAIVVMLGAIISLCVIKRLLSRFLRNLI